MIRQEREGKMKAAVLVVDDEKSVLKGLKMTLESRYKVFEASDGQEAIQVFRKENPDIVLLDIGLPDMSGLDVLHEIKTQNEETPVIMVTAVEEVKMVVEAVRKGAFNYLIKPVGSHEIQVSIKNALEARQLKEHIRTIQGPMVEKYKSHFICQNPAMLALLELSEKVTMSMETPTLIIGESGTGKGMLARKIHYSNSGSPGPFVLVNCSALSKELVESELFGYESGAFTGASPKGRKGRFETAGNGTLFLDEIGVMPLSVQVKLLNVLEDRYFYRVGGSKPIPVSARIIAATNTNLEEAVAKGEFRQDLFFRLNVVTLKLPPLRERLDEILPLSDHFMNSFNLRFKKKFETISPDARELLLSHHWPGNIRELRNTIERVVLMEDGNAILPDHLAFAIDRDAVQKKSGDLTLQDAENQYNRQVEKIIASVLEKADNNIQKAAGLLDIPVHKLRYLLKKSNER